MRSTTWNSPERKSPKAIRDKIPEIIRNSGKECAVKKLSGPEFLFELECKLEEELAEYLDSKELEELADLLEIIYRIAELRGASKESIEALRLEKKVKRGGFEKNLVLSCVPEDKCIFSDSHTPSEEFTRVVFRPEDSQVIEKHGVCMRIYTTKADCPNAAVLFQETDTGHAEEFIHEKSDFLYYVLEGSGTWVIEGREFKARAGDVVVVPAGKKFWFRGNLRQVCVTAPAWEEKYERHIRDIAL